MLIRDTEPHERGLFSVDPNIKSGRDYGSESIARRKAGRDEQYQSSVIAKVLGNDILMKLQSSNSNSGRSRRVDVEVLLQGAEKLSAVCEVLGSAERIANIRAQYDQLSSSIKRYEDKLSQQQASLNGGGSGSTGDDLRKQDFVAHGDITEEDEIRVVKELENKKVALEARLAEMDRDLGGLRR